MNENNLTPILYLPHGGGPLPIMGECSHASMIEFLKTVPAQLGDPKAILLISAHWEENQATITSGAAPELIYDYSGFPPETYRYKYPAPGAPCLAEALAELLLSKGIDSHCSPTRGFDHGMFIPLMLMYPDANIPCIQLSLLNSLDPQAHIDIGKALAPLREQGVLIVGSGLSFHNMAAMRQADAEGMELSIAFDHWLIESCCSASLSNVERERRLSHWKQAPNAEYCHPREEHLLPLHVCFGAASVANSAGQVVYNDLFAGKRISAFSW